MDLDLSLQRNETTNLYQTTARYFGPLSFKVLLMCRLTRASKFGQADDTGDDISASALRIGERPICHAASVSSGRRPVIWCFQVVKTAQIKRTH